MVAAAGGAGETLEGRRTRTLFTLAVAQSLVENGWTRGDFKRTDACGRTAYCLVGALDEAADGLELGLRASRRAAQTIMCVLGKHCPGVLPRWRLSLWNDGRQKLEVLAVLAKARRLCERETGVKRALAAGFGHRFAGSRTGHPQLEASNGT